MFQRQRTPNQGGMGFPQSFPTHPFMGQMPGRRPMMRNGGFPPQQGRGNPMMRNGPFPQMGGQGGSPTRQGGGGGLLSKILGRGNQGAGLPRGSLNPASAAAPASQASGGLLNALSNPSAINGFLTNTQKMLNTASQFGPMVQQYGPLVKNIPAMWKLYRGMNDSSDSSTSKDENKKIDSKVEKKKTSVNTAKKESHHIPNTEVKKQIGMSKPKLYI